MDRAAETVGSRTARETLKGALQPEPPRERPTGDPRQWSSAQWLAYNLWEAAQPEPPQWGPYENARQFYSSEEWLEIVRYTLENDRLMMHMAKQSGNQELIEWLKPQIAACERQLGLAPKAMPQFSFEW